MAKSNLSIVKDYLDGVRPYAKIGYRKVDTHRSVGEIWTDANGKTWEQCSGYVRNVNKTADIVRQYSKKTCKCCNADLTIGGNYLDDKSYKLSSMCYNCLINEDTEMRLNGTHKQHIKKLSLYNDISKLEESRTQLREYYDYIKQSDNTITFQNITGLDHTLVDEERWVNLDKNKVMRDLIIEYRSVMKHYFKVKKMIRELI